MLLAQIFWYDNRLKFLAQLSITINRIMHLGSKVAY
jgi:hypothetical protein